VNTWRIRQIENQKDQDTIQKLLPPWRKFLLSTHEMFRKVANVVLIPAVWLLEQFDGTADWKTREAYLDEVERKKRLRASA
ncbi:hypothetical protein, partial [Staphylococcus aureus]|uniref:hypothetical protein n=1 Tax=Staphylococcus aureus TaxID=1280 RepID=UPI0039BDD652